MPTAQEWYNLGYGGGGSVSGRAYNSKECFQQALGLKADFPEAWFRLGYLCDGTSVGGRSYSKEECLEKSKELYEKALELKADNSEAWGWLGVLGGGTVRGQSYNREECFAKQEECEEKARGAETPAPTPATTPAPTPAPASTSTPTLVPTAAPQVLRRGIGRGRGAGDWLGCWRWQNPKGWREVRRAAQEQDGADAGANAGTSSSSGSGVNTQPVQASEKSVGSCVICMSAPAAYACEPCGHICLCSDCNTSLLTCPVCRAPIQQVLRIFVATVD